MKRPITILDYILNHKDIKTWSIGPARHILGQPTQIIGEIYYVQINSVEGAKYFNTIMAQVHPNEVEEYTVPEEPGIYFLDNTGTTDSCYWINIDVQILSLFLEIDELQDLQKQIRGIEEDDITVD